MKTYKFFKANRLDQEFTLSLEEIKVKFIEWLKTKEKSYLQYYCGALAQPFIMDKDGLDSAMNREDYEKLGEDLKETKWEYLKSIGIN